MCGVLEKKLRLIKPDHGPDLPDLVFQPWPEDIDRPQARKKAVLRKRKVLSNTDKHEVFLLKRLVVLQDLFNDKELSRELKIPVQKRVINVPARGDRLFNTPLEKLLKAETTRWVDHVNKNPRNKMTYSKAFDIIDKIVKRK